MKEINFAFVVLIFSIFLQLQWRLCYSTSQWSMNNTDIHNLTDTNIELNATKVYNELIDMLNVDNVNNISQFNQSQSRNRRIYFPGTLWCGVIKLTVSNDEIGYFFDTDMCCKEHELCPREKYYATTSARPQETTHYGDHGIFYPRPPQTTVYYPTPLYPTYYPPQSPHYPPQFPHNPPQSPHYPTPPSPPYQPYYPPHYPHQQPNLPPHGGPSQPFYPQPLPTIHLPTPPQHRPYPLQPIPPTQNGPGSFQHQTPPVHFQPPPSVRHQHDESEQQTPLSLSTQTSILQYSKNYPHQLDFQETDHKPQNSSTPYFLQSEQISQDHPFQQLSQRTQGQSDHPLGNQGLQLVSQSKDYTPSRETEKDLDDLSRMMRIPKASNLRQRWAVGDSDCECDLRFYRCLNHVNNLISRKVGIIYFNLLHSQCVTFDHPVLRCTSRQGFMGWRCIEYQTDTTKPMVSQWRDNPYFHILS